MPTDPKQLNSKKKHSATSYARYSAMGIQMLAVIALGTFAGIKLDQLLGLTKTPVITIFCSLLSVVIAIYWVVKDLLKKE